MRRRSSAIASSGMSTRKRRISVSLDINQPPGSETTDGRTGWLRPEVPGQGPSPAPAEQLVPSHDRGPGRRIAPVTSLVRTLDRTEQRCDGVMLRSSGAAGLGSLLGFRGQRGLFAAVEHLVDPGREYASYQWRHDEQPHLA